MKVKVPEVTVHPELPWVGVAVKVAVGDPGVGVRDGVKVAVRGAGV